MRLPRPLLRFGVMFYVAAMAYLFCLILVWPKFLAGGYLLLMSSQVSLLVLCRGGTRRPSWIAFGVAAASMFGALMLSFRVLPIRLGWWPQRLYRGYRWFLWSVPYPVTEWLLAHVHVFDPEGRLTDGQIVIVLELCYGLPLFLACLVVSLLVGRVGRSRIVDGGGP